MHTFSPPVFTRGELITLNSPGNIAIDSQILQIDQRPQIHFLGVLNIRSPAHRLQLGRREALQSRDTRQFQTSAEILQIRQIHRRRVWRRPSNVTGVPAQPVCDVADVGQLEAAGVAAGHGDAPVDGRAFCGDFVEVGLVIDYVGVSFGSAFWRADLGHGCEDAISLLCKE